MLLCYFIIDEKKGEIMIKVNNLTKKFMKYKNKKEKEEFYADNKITFQATVG